MEGEREEWKYREAEFPDKVKLKRSQSRLKYFPVLLVLPFETVWWDFLSVTFYDLIHLE